MAAFSNSLPSQARVCVCVRERESHRDGDTEQKPPTVRRRSRWTPEWMVSPQASAPQTDEARAEPTGSVGTVILSLLPLSVLDRFPMPSNLSTSSHPLSLPPRPFGMGS